MPTRQTRVLQLYPNLECPSHRRPVVLRLSVLTNIKQKLRVMLSFMSIIMILRGGGFPNQHLFEEEVNFTAYLPYYHCRHCLAWQQFDLALPPNLQDHLPR